MENSLPWILVLILVVSFSEKWIYFGKELINTLRTSKITSKAVTISKNILIANFNENDNMSTSSTQLQKSRKLLLKSVCQNDYFRQTGKFSRNITHFLTSKGMNYDSRNNIFYCLNAKTGITNWKMLASAIYRNITIEQMGRIIETGGNDFNIYADLPTLKMVTEKSPEIKNGCFILNLRHLTIFRTSDR